MKPYGAIFSAHRGLPLDVGLARVKGYTTYSDDEYLHAAQVVTALFPGLELHTLRPVQDVSLAVFTWDAEELLARRILTPPHISELHERGRSRLSICSHNLLAVRRVTAGRLRVRIDVADSLSEAHPLWILRPSAIRGRVFPRLLQPRLVLDNSRAAAFEPTPRRGQLRLIE
jgi:hypothetical protein